MSHILIVEDETIIRSALRRLLERNQYEVSEAGSVQEAQERYSIPGFDLIVSDLRLPGAPGTELIKLAEGTPVLIMTSYASLRSAVDSMKMGAVDYIAKPFDHDEMLQTVARILQDHQQSAAALAQPSRGNGSAPSDAAQGDIGIIGHCAPMQDLFSKIRKVAPTDSNVLIQGESGTGKELVARALHNLATGQGADDLGELRGHSGNPDRIRAVRPRRGLHRGQRRSRRPGRGSRWRHPVPRRNRRTATGSQARLLRVLQEGEIRRVGSVQSQKVDVRLIAATHRDLKPLPDRPVPRRPLLPPARDRAQAAAAASAATACSKSPRRSWRARANA